MKTIYFVALLFKETEFDRIVLRQEIIVGAKTNTEALGAAIYRNPISSDFVLINHSVEKFKPEEKDEVAIKANEEKLQLEGFLNLLTMCGPTITSEAVKIFSMGKNVPAIKFVREYIKPWIDLKEAKDIIETWQRQIDKHSLTTPLLDLVKAQLRMKGYEI